MADHDQEQLRNATVAFMQAVAFTVAVHDTTMRGEMSAEEFLETVDQALEIRLKQPDGVELAVLLLRLRDNFRKMVSKTKVLLEDKGSAKKRGHSSSAKVNASQSKLTCKTPYNPGSDADVGTSTRTNPQLPLLFGTALPGPVDIHIGRRDAVVLSLNKASPSQLMWAHSRIIWAENADVLVQRPILRLLHLPASSRRPLDPDGTCWGTLPGLQVAMPSQVRRPAAEDCHVRVCGSIP